MDIQELNKISPLRVFDDAINGGLGKGNLGVIVSRHGVGKTACLVHLATDKLLRGENVIHVSFSGNVEHVMNWYKEVFKEIAEIQSLDDAHNVYASILANRVVMNFSQSQISIEKVLSSLKSLIEQGAFQNLRGVIYFTDGYGTYPSRMPSYETAFVFIDDGSRDIRTPAWAIRLVLDEAIFMESEEE